MKAKKKMSAEEKKAEQRRIAKQNRRRGKGFQSKLASFLPGAKNVGTLGGEDVTWGEYSIECKTRQAFVGQTWMNQELNNCPEGKVPVVVVHVVGSSHKDDLILIRLSDFLEAVRA